MGRYTLKINDQPIKGFIKVGLDDIDKFTVNFDSISSILEKLELKDIKGIKNLKITYQMYQMEKKLDVALENKNDLKYIKIEANGKINYGNRVFSRYANIFCEKIRNDKQFYKFIMSSKMINEKLKQYIELDVKNNNIFYEDKIKEHLGTYLQFRNILFLLEEYEWYVVSKQYSKASEIENEEEVRLSSPLDGEDYTDEEKAAYQEYMDNLPDDEPDYKMR